MYVEPVIQSLRALQPAFPTIAMEIADHPPFDFLATFPRQAGLTFNISVEMDADELHVSVDGHLVLEVWTHNHPERIAEAIDDIRGLLAGEYRAVVYRARDSVVMTELQAPAASGWDVVGGWWELGKDTERDQLVSQVFQNSRSLRDPRSPPN